MNNCRTKGLNIFNWRPKKTFSDFFPTMCWYVCLCLFMFCIINFFHSAFEMECWWLVNAGYLTQGEGRKNKQT